MKGHLIEKKQLIDSIICRLIANENNWHTIYPQLCKHITYKGTPNDFNGIMQIQHPPLPLIVSDDVGVL